MKLCIGIAKGWSEHDLRLKSWVNVLQSQALTEHVFEFDIPDYKLLNSDVSLFCQKLSENIEKASDSFKLLPRIIVLPYQDVFLDETECLDKIAYFIKKIFCEKSMREPVVLVMCSAFYHYQHADFIDFAQCLLTDDEEKEWAQDKVLNEKSVLSLGVPFQLSKGMCRRAAMQEPQSKELELLNKYDKKILFVLGEISKDYQVKFDVADALRMADRALDFAAKGYHIIFINQPATPDDVTDFMYDFCLRNHMSFYNRKALNGPLAQRYDGKFKAEFTDQQQKCGDMYLAILSVLENGIYIGTMGNSGFISDALALKLRTMVYRGNNVEEKRYDCNRLADICVRENYVFDFYDDRVLDSKFELKAFPSSNYSILRLMLDQKFPKLKAFSD